MAITKELFGTLPNGQDITAYLLDNGNGVSARILNYGGIVRNLYVEVLKPTLCLDAKRWKII